MALSHESSGGSASNRPQQRRRRVNNELDAEFRYHAGGALYIPRPPSPEPVPSVSLPPDSVPSTAALPLPHAILSEHVAANSDDGSVAEESHQSSVDKEENDPSSPPKKNSDTSEKLHESEEDCQSLEDKEKSEDDSSMFSSEYVNDASELVADKTRKPKRKHQENQSQKEKGFDGVTRTTKWSRYSGNQNIEKWNQRLEELKKFKAKHGHCILPKSSKTLYQWLCDQRKRCLNPNHSDCLVDGSERERRTKELESVLGTSRRDWTSVLRMRIATAATKWDARLEELEKFKAKHGHCRVPASSAALHNWLRNQRTKFLNPNHWLYLNDAPERERRTKELESVLGASLLRIKDCENLKRITAAILWNERLEELKKFKAKHHHCNVPPTDRALYTWMKNQRDMLLNPNHVLCLQDVPERERRTKELESVLGESLRGADKERKAEAIG